MPNMSWTWAQSHTPKMRTDNRPLPEIYALLRQIVKPGEVISFGQIRKALDKDARRARDACRSLILHRMLDRMPGSKDTFKMLENPANMGVREAFRGRCVAQRKSPVDAFKGLGIDPRTGIDWMQGRANLDDRQAEAVAKWARA